MATSDSSLMRGALQTGQFLGKFEFDGVFCAFGFDHAHDFGDDVAAFFEDDGIAFPDIFAFEFFGVVQCGAADCGARQLHGFEVCHWGDDACAPDLKGYAFEHGFGLFGRIFVGDCPARAFGCGAEFVLLCNAVDFDDDAVDVVFQFLAFFLPFAGLGDDVVNIVAQGAVGVDGQAEAFEVGEVFAMR